MLPFLDFPCVATNALLSPFSPAGPHLRWTVRPLGASMSASASRRPLDLVGDEPCPSIQSPRDQHPPQLHPSPLMTSFSRPRRSPPPPPHLPLTRHFVFPSRDAAPIVAQLSVDDLDFPFLRVRPKNLLCGASVTLLLSLASICGDGRPSNSATMVLSPTSCSSSSSSPHNPSSLFLS